MSLGERPFRLLRRVPAGQRGVDDEIRSLESLFQALRTFNVQISVDLLDVAAEKLRNVVKSPSINIH